MRTLIPLALAASTAVAFNQPHQDSTFMATHHQVRTDSAIQENRIVKRDASFASFYTPMRRLVTKGLLSSCFGGICGKSTKKPASKPASQPASRPANRPASQHGSPPVSKPASRPASQHGSPPVSKPASQPASRPASRPKQSKRDKWKAMTERHFARQTNQQSTGQGNPTKSQRKVHLTQQTSTAGISDADIVPR
ncbi:hypothetical protein Ae201684P_020437 [Aphanomyces euteiches]|uniref:RxLR effector protein n=1 Tax=Aphanomyces euteiches TaxID=100861 RepID=A0A6G0WGD3_9STRA|nr:hypothetical protein Ae201684_015613 [Aphanomyces euteiches]KAH9084185.1 hypothetical protein Ae201684P_020437 [Aphanomyces euteiches]